MFKFDVVNTKEKIEVKGRSMLATYSTGQGATVLVTNLMDMAEKQNATIIAVHWHKEELTRLTKYINTWYKATISNGDEYSSLVDPQADIQGSFPLGKVKSLLLESEDSGESSPVVVLLFGILSGDATSIQSLELVGDIMNIVSSNDNFHLIVAEEVNDVPSHGFRENFGTFLSKPAIDSPEAIEACKSGALGIWSLTAESMEEKPVIVSVPFIEI